MRILVWSLKFAHAAGVGARRWRKLSHYLSELGHQFTVVTADTVSTQDPIRSTSTQGKDVEIVTVRRGSRRVLIGSLLSLPLASRVWLRATRLAANLRGDIDLHERWARRSISTVQRLLRGGRYDVLVATGHPTSLNYWASIIHSQFPGVLLVQDFRDTWNDEEPYRLSRTRLSQKAKERSVYAEYVSVRSADALLTVSGGQARRIMRSHRDVAEKLYVIPHGYDPHVKRVRPSRKRSDITVAHAGSLRWESKRRFRVFLDAIKLLDAELKDRIRFRFYGSNPFDATPEDLRTLARNYVEYRGYVSEEELHWELEQADAGLVFFEKRVNLGTKLFDYMAADLPVMTIAPAGELTTFMDGVGLPTTPPNDREQTKLGIEKLSDLVDSGWRWGALREAYEYDAIAKQLSEVLTTLQESLNQYESSRSITTAAKENVPE